MTVPRSRFLRRASALAVGAIALAACGSDGNDASGSGAVATSPATTPATVAATTADTAAPTPTSADAAAGFGQTFASGQSLGDATFDGESLDGVDAVVWFWAPWCTVCRAEAPDVAEVAAEYGDRLQIIGVAGRGEVPAMDDFVAETGTAGFTHVADLDGSIWSSFGVFAQPAFAFINDDGSVETFVGSLGKQALSEQIDELLAR